MRLKALGEPNARALPTPSNAHTVMHGKDTSRKASDNTSSRTVLLLSPANTLTTATAIIQTLGLINCRVEAPNTLRPSSWEAVSPRDGGALLKICHASQLNQSTPAQAIACCTRGNCSRVSPTPSPTASTISVAVMHAPKMMGSVATSPRRELWLNTRILVGPGVIEATNANSKKGSNDSMAQTP